MRKKSIHKIVIFLLLITSTYTIALPITQADAFIVGDNKAAYDINTGLIWMDFGITDNKSYNQIESELDTIYQGWRLSTAAEARTFWKNLFGGYDGWNENGFFGPSIRQSGLTSEFHSIIDIIGSNGKGTFTLTVDGQLVDSYEILFGRGIFSNNNALGFVNFFTPFDKTTEEKNSTAYHIDFLPSLNRDALNPGFSTLLVRNEPIGVPESSSFLLISIGLLGLLISRRYCA